MADRFEDVPPLPREPTAINVPDAMGNPTSTSTPTTTDTPPIADTLPPPPKFPSLTDVDLSVAKSAAEAQGMPQQPSEDTAALSTTTTATTQTATSHPSVDPASISDVQPLESDVSTEQTIDVLSDSTSSRPTSALHEDIEAAIQRASVTPGTGERKVNEIGQQLWTTADQQELDRLLAEGREVFIPPDVETGDLPVPRSKNYYYIPIPSAQARDSGVDVAPDTRTMADRIAIWNQVGTEESASRSSPVRAMAAVGAAGAAGASVGAGATAGVAAIDDATSAPAEQIETVQSTSSVGDTTRDVTSVTTPTDAPTDTPTDHVSGATEGLEATSQSTTDKGLPTVRSNADVSRSIFGGDFLTVPVIAQKATNGATVESPGPADEDLAKTTEVMLRSNASANINIKDDYGLKGGHTAGCNDATFLDEKNTLVTCGADGKVCIWDMTDGSVTREFVPYDGEPVTMVYPMTDDGDGESYTIMTLSESRLMRIWTIDAKQAVMLRSTQIQSSDKDLFMSVPVISRELKVRATAAAAAAAVRTTTDATEAPIEAGTAAAGTTATVTSAPLEPDTAADAVVGDITADAAAETAAESAPPAPTAEEKEEEKDRKRFSFTKVLSFGRSSTRKAVAS